MEQGRLDEALDALRGPRDFALTTGKLTTTRASSG